MSAEWFIIDTRSGRIVNCVTTSKPGGPDVGMFLNAEHLTATTTPTTAQLHGYRYFWERP